MADRPKHPLFSPEDERAADALGVFSYLRTVTGRFRLARLLAALDEAQNALNVLKLDPWDPQLLAPLAAEFLRADRKVIGWFWDRKSTEVSTKAQVDRLHKLLGLAVTEKYLKKRKKPKHQERPLASYQGIERELRELVDRMRELGQVTEAEAEFAKDIAIEKPEFGDGVQETLAVLEQVVGTYESLVPEVDSAGDEIPRFVQERGIAKAAFLRLRAEELTEIADAEGLTDLPTREALATALSERFAGEHDRVAELVLKQEEGDPEYGLITRLIPLDRIPHLDETKRRVEPLIGRYFETRVAQWFVFREIESDQNSLRITGRVRGYSVRPAEVSGDARLNASPHKDDVTIVLRRGINWAATDARRPADLAAVKLLLKRAEIGRPLDSVPGPDPLTQEPYSEWDPRTLWLLELLQHELYTDPFEVDNVLMVNFEKPAHAEKPTEDRPDVQAVRLRGTRLDAHPEVCSLITRSRHMFEIQFRLRNWTDRSKGQSTLRRARLTWAPDHLAVMTGDVDGRVNVDLHNRLVRVVRDAAGRPVDAVRLRHLLGRIERNAVAAETDELDSVLLADSGDGDGGAAGAAS